MDTRDSNKAKVVYLIDAGGYQVDTWWRQGDAPSCYGYACSGGLIYQMTLKGHPA